MEELFRDPENPLSAWKVDSERRIYTGSPSQVEVVTSPLEADPVAILRDPPLQIDDIRDIDEGKPPSITKELNTVALDYEDVKQLRKTARPSSQDPESRERVAPSQQAVKQDVNTIEIVKKNGMYSFVIDGVSNGEIKPNSAGDFEEERYWMPRFKEYFRKGNRSVRPVLFSLRLEDYESAPKRCAVQVVQKVINEGTVVMPWTVVKKEEIIHHSVSDTTNSVTVLPYPMMCTPQPSIAINDYSKMREAELLLTVSADKRILGATTRFLKKALAQVVPGSGASSMRWNDFVQLGVAIKQAAKDALTSAAPGAVASAATGAGFLGTGIGGIATFMLWQYISARHKVDDWDIKAEDRERLFGVHEAECSKDPLQYKFTLDELTSSIFRIAETRANGSVVGDRTIGLGVHDLLDQRWRAEAALLQYLQYGEMNRPKDKKSSPDPVTGRYNTRQNIEQNKALRNTPLAAGITGNTVSVAGADPLTNCNTRTEFAYIVSIEEEDGVPGPRVLIESTRMNGIDAGWISAQYDRKLDQCRAAASYLELKLMSMPGVGHWVRGHSTLVADTNNGTIVGDRFDMNVNALLGRLYTDTSGAANTAQKIKEAVAREKKKADSSTKSREKKESTLKTKNKQVGTLENDISTANERYDEKVRSQNKKARDDIEAAKERAEDKKEDVQNNENLLNEEKLDKIEQIEEDLKEKIESIEKRLATQRGTLDKTYNKRKGTLEGRLMERQSEAADASDDLLQEQRKERVLQLRTKAAGGRRNFANIFDYDAFMKRLRMVLIGYEYDSYTLEDAESERERVRREYLSQRSFWRRITLQSAKEKPLVEEHEKRSLEFMSMSLSLPTRIVGRDNLMFVRFLHLHSPPYIQKDASAMRMAAFVVPSKKHWDLYTPQHKVLRTLPQVIVVSKSLVSTFGNVSILRPMNLPSSIITQEPNAVMSTSNATDAMNYTSSQLYLSDLSIFNGSCHFHQVYNGINSRGYDYSSVFDNPIFIDSRPIKMTASSAVPSLVTIGALDAAVESGGENYAMVERLVAGKTPEGTARILQQIGASHSYAGLMAMVAFAEILALNLLKQGTSSSSRPGFQTQRDELVFSSMHNARKASVAVANFISKNYVSKKISILKIQRNDVAFHCLPGMTYLHVALKVLGLYEEDGTVVLSNLAFSEHFARSLQKIASSSSAPYRILPFTCVQSLVLSVPAAVSSLNSEQPPIVTHIHSLVHSFKRMVSMLSVFKVSMRPFAVPLVDCICSRPVLLKAVYVDPDNTASIVASAYRYNPQAGWQTPAARISRKALLHRWARLRVNVLPELRNEAAISPLAYGSKKQNIDAYDSIVQSMLSLDIRKLDTISPSPSATYVVPFGAVSSATPRDMSHMNFESHPVWLSVLKEVIAVVRIDASLSAHPDRNAVVCQPSVVSGRPRNPLAVEFSNNTVYISLDDSISNIDIDTTNKVDYNSVLDICGLAKSINTNRHIASLSGKLSQSYRACMHNAERVFQACMLVASGAYHDIDKDSTIFINNKGSKHVGMLAVCACVGSAVASAETGVQTRAFVLNGSNTEEHHKAVEQAARVMEQMCHSLESEGVKAVPFSEMCMCAAVL